MLFRATGRRPRFIGKPQPDMVNLAVAKSGFSKEQAILLGDRLYTDIETGLRSGMLSILVMSGETTEAMLAESPTKPDLKFGRLADMIPLL